MAATQEVKKEFGPNQVVSASPVELAMVSYTDSGGEVITQFAIVGTSNVVLLDSKTIGIGQERTPAGKAHGWLRDGILKAMGRGA